MDNDIEEADVAIEQPGNSVMTAVIHENVLGKLLADLKIKVSKEALATVCTQQDRDRALLPAERLNNVLRVLDVKYVQVGRLRWDRLDRRKLPVLLYVNDAWHYAEAISDNKILLTPPEGEPFKMDGDEPQQAPVLWLRSLKKDISAPKPTTTAFDLILKEVWRDKTWFVEVLVATLVINVMAVATSLYAMQVYDRVVPTFAYSTLIALSVGMIIAIILDWILVFIRSKITDNLGKHVDQAVSQHIFEHVMNLRLDKRPKSLGVLASQINGIEHVRRFFSSSILFFMADLPFCLFFIAVIYVVGGDVGSVYAILFPIALLTGIIAQFRLRKLAKNEIRGGNERHGLLVDSLRGTETIQATGCAWRFADSWYQIVDMVGRYSLKSKIVTSTALATTASIGKIGYMGALVVGVTCVEAGELTSGGMIACAILGGRVMQPIAKSVQFQVQWQHVRESLAMVNQVLALETFRQPGRNLLFPDKLNDSLEFNSVRFSHNDSPVMHVDIEKLSFKGGDRVVILGPNGCGKSTFLKIAAGLYRPAEGQVRVGGTDIFELDPQVLNEHLGYLPQDVHLFKGTLKSNMMLSGGILDSSMLEVAEKLGIDKIAADNPRAMELEISEGGYGLSGGQRQLVALSRLFLAKPRVWLLDEPSASVDIEAEERMLTQLQSTLRSNDILIIATHRPKLTALANRVIIMRDGKVMNDGKPQDVLNNNVQRRPQAQINVQGGNFLPGRRNNVI
ncbi:MAG: ATP-binding cassette domain-containing protein [Desulfotalea sp.]